MIRTISATLAAVGIIWSLSALMGLVIPFVVLVGVLTGEKLDEFGTVMLLVSFQVYCGYFIWVGWIFRACGFRFLLQRRTFWMASSAHHLLWVTLLLIGSSPKHVQQSESFAAILFGYLGFALIASVLFTFIDREKMDSEKAQALTPDRLYSK